MKKQFNLEYYLAHPETKVVTRDGRDVRILCTDLDDKNFPIAAAYINSGRNGTAVDSFAANGRVLLSSLYEHGRDLFFDIPDPEKKRVPLTFEDLLDRIKSGKTMWISCDTNVYAKLIIGFNSNSISAVNGIDTCPDVARFHYIELLHYNFVDGDPCWKWKEVDE